MVNTYYPVGVLSITDTDHVEYVAGELAKTDSLRVMHDVEGGSYVVVEVEE